MELLNQNTIETIIIVAIVLAIAILAATGNDPFPFKVNTTALHNITARGIQ
jgi:hypothetical protein